MVADMDGVVVAGLVGQCPPLRDLVDQVRLQHEPALQAFAEPLHYSSDMRPESGVRRKKKKLELYHHWMMGSWGEISCCFLLELCGETICKMNVPLDVNSDAGYSSEKKPRKKKGIWKETRTIVVHYKQWLPYLISARCKFFLSAHQSKHLIPIVATHMEDWKNMCGCQSWLEHGWSAPAKCIQEPHHVWKHLPLIGWIFNWTFPQSS